VAQKTKTRSTRSTAEPVGPSKVTEATNALLNLWESGDMPAAMARVAIRKQAGEVPSDGWSFGNQLLQLLAGTEDGRTYKAWLEVGRQVSKGAKAFYILAPVVVSGTRKNEITGLEEKVHFVKGLQGHSPVPLPGHRGQHRLRPGVRRQLRRDRPGEGHEGASPAPLDHREGSHPDPQHGGRA
jgi:hypothetical protein